MIGFFSLVFRGLVPNHGVAGAPTCKYHPSCSAYASEAIRKYGPVRGSLKAAWRIARCNPWSQGGVDHP